MKFSIAYIRLSIIIFLGTLVFNSHAQQNNALYYMQGLPQSLQLNPAMQPKCGFFLALPSFELNLGNSGVGFNDILINQPDHNRMVWFLYDHSTRSNFIDKFKNNNNIYSDFSLNALSLGLRVKGSYFFINAGTRFETRNTVPQDLARILIESNIDSVGGQKRSYDLSGFGVNGTMYNEFSLGFSKEINSKLTLGMTGKVLFGIANITTNSSRVELKDGGIESYKINSVIDLNTSIPNLSVVEAQDGTVDSLKFKEVEDEAEAVDIFTNTRNFGLAFDFGAVYKISEKLNVSLSVIDLGFIKWKDNLNRFVQDASYDYKGLVFSSTNDSVDFEGDMLDTLKSNFKYASVNDPYNTWLPTKIYAGVFFRPVKFIGLGLLTRQQIMNKKLRSQYTASLNLYPSNAFNLTFSYTIADGMYDNFGFGTSFKFLPFIQMYMLTERIPLYWNKNKGDGIPFIPAYYKNFNFRFGLNIALGYKHREKKLKKDKPLVDL